MPAEWGEEQPSALCLGNDYLVQRVLMSSHLLHFRLYFPGYDEGEKGLHLDPGDLRKKKNQ